MKWKLNAAELLIPNSSGASGAFHIEMTLGLLLLWLLSQFPDCWKLRSTQVHRQHTHPATSYVQSQWVRTCIARMERFRPVWK